jgi:transposase
MKKLLLLTLISGALISTTQAQGPAKPAAQPPTAEQYATMLKEAKEKQVPMLVEKAGLTKEQAEKVIEINFETRREAGTALAGLNDTERTAKLAELKAAKEKKYSEIPLTAEQIKAMYAAYEEMGKNSQRQLKN